MLGTERRRFITRRLAAESSVSTATLARELHVSGETVRRDLMVLETEGLLIRVYGGAIAPDRRRTSEAPFVDRAGFQADAKSAIGHFATTLLTGETSVFLDVGTTAAAVAVALRGSFTGLVTTHSLLVANTLGESGSAEVQLAPGRVRRGEWSLTGTATYRYLQSMHFDVALLSCGGVDAKVGATDFNADDVEIKRTVARNSRRVYVLADSSKHGVVGSFEIGDWYDMTGLITDSPPPEGITAAIRAAQGELHVTRGAHPGKTS